MPSYFVDRPPAGDAPLLHERGRCPPPCFPAGRKAEYLGDLLDGPQALRLARLKYPAVRPCGACAARERDPSTTSYVSSSPAAPILRAA